VTSPLDWELGELAIELTTWCNLECRMCSVWEGKSKGPDHDLTRRLLEDGRALGATSFVPCGAENFMRKDFVDLVAYADSLGYERQEIVTNGILLPRHLDRLQDIPSVHLHVSIDGPEAVHDDLRGSGNYALAMDAVRQAHDRGISVGLSGVLMRPTLDTATHLIDLTAELGLGQVSFQPFQPEINGMERSHGEWIFPPEDRERVGDCIEELRAHAARAEVPIYTDNILDEVVPYLFDGIRPIPEGGCYMPSRFLLVDVSGDVYPCFFMRQLSIGNVKKGDRLADLWHSEAQMALQMLGLTRTCPGCLAACSDIATFDASPQLGAVAAPELMQLGAAT
jgi:MoaA/NifB/PqqE/SkfB family radical SAM enzyme